MNNTKTTKRALLSSVLAMLICVAMLIGTTFAWFTDSASTAVNKIQAGTLDIELQYQKADSSWEDAEGKTLNFKKAVGHESEAILWEPGCTYELPAIRIKNNGNLALKYELAITGIKGDAKLNEAIEWTNGTDELLSQYEGTMIPGQHDNVTDPIVIKGHMKPDAGNEYQGLSIDGIGITVVATQLASEFDSTTDQYDTNATYLNTDADGHYLISNANELVYFAKSVNVDRETYAGKTVKLTADIDLAGKKWIPVGQTGGYSAANRFQGTFDGQNHTIKNLTIPESSWEAGNDDGKNFATGFFGFIDVGGQTIKNVTFDNATVEGHHWVGVVAGYMTGTIETVVVKNSTVTCTYKTSEADGDKAGGVTGCLNSGSVTGCRVENSTVTAVRDCGSIVGFSTTNGNVTGNTAQDCTVYYSTNETSQIGGEIAGKRANGVSGNTATNVTVTKLVTVSNATELRELAADSTVTNASITLPKTTAEAPLTTNISVPGGKNLTINGATSNPADTVINGQIATTASNEETLVIRNCTINVDDNIVDSTGISQTGSSAIAIWGDQKVICENVVFNMSKADSTAITSWWDTGVGTNIIARNCTFNCNGQRPIRATCNVTVENCTFNDPYRYAVQLTSKSNTAVGIENAVINFNNNTINNGASGKAFVYGVQLEGEDYGCQNLIINGSGNTINAGEWDTGNESTMYYCECGLVQHNTITWNTEVVPVHKVP